MRKSFLLIALFFSFVAAVAGNQASGRVVIAPAEKNSYNISPSNYPHTELETFTGSSLVVNHRVRVHGFHYPGLQPVAVVDKNFFQAYNKEASLHFSFKEYLSHIYPSHHFW